MAKVKLATTKGDVVIELNEDKAPITTENFLGYVNDGFYDGTIFHRVIPGFMVQCGGMTEDLKPKKTKEPIKNEAANGLTNQRGAVAMARTAEPDSATAQFFINTVNNDFLNYGVRDQGYAVFAKVTEGMDTVEEIEAVPTRPGDVPKETIKITKAEVIE